MDGMNLYRCDSLPAAVIPKVRRQADDVKHGVHPPTFTFGNEVIWNGLLLRCVCRRFLRRRSKANAKDAKLLCKVTDGPAKLQTQ